MLQELPQAANVQKNPKLTRSSEHHPASSRSCASYFSLQQTELLASYSPGLPPSVSIARKAQPGKKFLFLLVPSRVEAAGLTARFAVPGTREAARELRRACGHRGAHGEPRWAAAGIQSRGLQNPQDPLWDLWDIESVRNSGASQFVN